MSIILKNKLPNLINEIKEIKKEVIFLEIKKTHSTKHKLNKWELLGEKVSSKWNKIPAVEETSQQREKSW